MHDAKTVFSGPHILVAGGNFVEHAGFINRGCFSACFVPAVILYLFCFVVNVDDTVCLFVCLSAFVKSRCRFGDMWIPGLLSIII